LELLLSDARHPGGPPRRVAPGAPADLCLLATPLEVALEVALAEPAAVQVACTIRRGRIIWRS
jgi:hypothetical protein